MENKIQNKVLIRIAILIVFSIFTTSTFAGNKIQWQKFLNDTTIGQFSPNWILQGMAIDSQNNIYACIIQNGRDTSMSVLYKYTPEGELLFKKTIVPFSLNEKIVTRYDRKAKLYLDINDDLVFIVAGHDTSIQNNITRILLFTKWDKNGNLITQKIEQFNSIDTLFNPDDLGDIQVLKNGDIYISEKFEGNSKANIFIKGYNINFDSIYNNEIKFPYDYYRDFKNSPILFIDDSLITLAYTYSIFIIGQGSVSYETIYQINKQTMDTNWINTNLITNYIAQPIEIFKKGNFIYLADGSLKKINYNTGIILKENSINNTYKCIFDTISNKIFTNGGTLNTLEDLYDIKVYDFDLNLKSIITTPYVVRTISKKENIISVTGLFSDFSGARTNKYSIYRFDTAGVILDSIFNKLEEPAEAVLGNINSILDNKKDLINFYESTTKYFYDSVGQIHYTAPILIQKICYNCIDDLKGKVYLDSQPNCKFDSTENIIENNIVHLMPEDIYTTTDTLGNYSFVKNTGIATVEYIPRLTNSYLCNSSPIYTVDLANGVNDTLNFGVNIEGGFYKDIVCSINCGQARNGFKQYVSVSLDNQSGLPLYNVPISLTIDTMFSYFSSLIAPDSIVGNSIFWHFDTMNIGAVKNINLMLQVSVNAPVSYAYHHSVQTTVFNDINLINNVDTFFATVTNSFDPNYKSANPIGISSKHYVENGTTLNYYIEFQNTGNDTAFNIKVVDVLDNNLDISTLKITGSTHKVYYKLENRKLIFYFDNVLLVDSNRDYDKSIGHITYSIKPKQCLDGTVINNKAEIYFDYNAPIITNTTFHTIGKVGSYFENTTINDFNIFPNPSFETATNIVVNMVTGSEYELVIFDSFGKEIQHIKKGVVSNGKYYHSINVSNLLGAGVYLVKLKTKNNTITKKLVLMK